MAYSRWTNSIWYTYWSAASRRDDWQNQVFIADKGDAIATIVYSEVNKWTKEKILNYFSTPDGYTFCEEQAEELLEYIQEWKREVDYVFDPKLKEAREKYAAEQQAKYDALPQEEKDRIEAERKIALDEVAKVITGELKSTMNRESPLRKLIMENKNGAER